MKSITVQYFAALREQALSSTEVCATRANTPAELYAERCQAHGFTFPQDQMKVAVNDRFAAWDDRLNEGDCVVFIPPVAGG